MKHKETLEDFIYDHMDDEDLIYKIEEQLDAMPRCRKSAEELLDTIKSFDGFPEIYKKLFVLKDFLTEEETAQVKEEYESNFDLEFVGEIED